MFQDVRFYSSLFQYTPDPTPGWGPDIPAHITPQKTAGAPDVPATFGSYWEAENNAYCSVVGTSAPACSGKDVVEIYMHVCKCIWSILSGKVKAGVLNCPEPHVPFATVWLKHRCSLA